MAMAAPEVLGRLLVDAAGRGATDAHDPPVAAVRCFVRVQTSP